jgi:hypothetical protein
VRSPPETYLDTDTQPKRIAWLSARDPHKRFDSLMHHCNERSLAACFHELDGTRAVGSDGIDKAQYGAELDANLCAVLIPAATLMVSS